MGYIEVAVHAYINYNKGCIGADCGDQNQDHNIH